MCEKISERINTRVERVLINKWTNKGRSEKMEERTN